MKNSLKALAAAATVTMALTPVAFAAKGGPHGGGGMITLAGNHNGWLISQSHYVSAAPTTRVMDLSIILKAQKHNFDGQSMTLQQYVQATQDPSSPLFHKFLSATDFANDFTVDPSAVVAFLTKHGFTVTGKLNNNLVIKATAPVGTVESTFNVKINEYQYGNKTFFGSNQDPQVPSSVGNLILAIAGLSTFSNFSTHLTNSNSFEAAASSTTSPPPPPDKPGHAGEYGPQKVKDFYNVTPLYSMTSNPNGTGVGTLAIATLANFNPKDAQHFWNYYNIPRTGTVNVKAVDGGFGSGAAPGAGETALDVEQSGSLAPNANIDVYEAPNTNPGFLDLFYQVAADNAAATMSVSWGEDEKYETPAYHQAMNQAFMEGAAEGISMFAAAGDDGAYDSGSHQLGVDSPASDPNITAAGGTIYPGMAYHHGGTAKVQKVPQESAWGWDWTLPLYSLFGFNSVGQWKHQIYPVGGGGGVSNTWAMPWYQSGVQGVAASGRNVPDISLNADPFAGYALYDSFSGGPYGSGWSYGWGGTSFVAPQLNGITALMDSILGHRQGLLNPMLYSLAQKSSNFSPAQTDGSNTPTTAPFYDITKGDNWYYHATTGYDQATGIGSINVDNLFKDLKSYGQNP